ncbi:MAG: glycosyl hydrolase family 57 [Actinobacteria bacterium]|nr:MAG: glycosyl hydrolase family 57 [Actinomycetota bacterium]
MQELSEYIDALPNLSGSEDAIAAAIARGRETPVFAGQTPVNIADIDSAFAIALHMHQPLIPAGGGDQRSAAIISNLQDMAEHPGIGDNHNWSVFAWCYERMGEFIPQLISEGFEPRVMLEYSGTLLHGLRRMGRTDVLDALAPLARDPGLRRAVEWLGCPWGHAVAPSTPVQDFRLHVSAWQHHFAAIFGLEALGRVRGFSPAEMALPNHPDVVYEFVKTLKSAGYEWVLVQEHTVEALDGRPPERKHLPHRLIVTNSSGDSADIVAIVKTQGSDTKLVARGVMMNEFPPKYFDVVRECSHSRTPAMNVTEYLEQLYAAGIRAADLPAIQPLFQHRIWARMASGDGPQRLHTVIEELRREDERFHMEGGSWTSDISWVRGYDRVLIPMEQASLQFHDCVLAQGIPTDDPRYRNALFHLLTAETSCFRYWGEGIWTDYGAELSRRTTEIVTHDF